MISFPKNPATAPAAVPKKGTIVPVTAHATASFTRLIFLIDVCALLARPGGSFL